MKGISFMQKIHRRKLQKATQGYLEGLETSTARPQLAAQAQLAALSAGAQAKYLFGTMAKGQRIELHAEKGIAHGLLLGASGAGKSYAGLNLALQLLQEFETKNAPAFGVLDPKGELFTLVLSYLYAIAYRLPENKREKLRRKVYILDFSHDVLISPYHLLASQPGVPEEVLVASRIEMISEQFSGLSPLTVRMKQCLKPFLQLMVEFNLPLPFFEKLCTNPLLLTALVERSQNPLTQEYFRYRFANESKGTVMALQQRIDALLVSPGVRLSLSAPSAPDFAQLQDEGAIILINTAGRFITRGISELLLGILFADLKQSIFRRANPQQKYLWLCDEVQNLCKTAMNREGLFDVLTMSRSFGSFLLLMTQSLTSSIHDQEILNAIMTNVRWVLMLRSTLRDAALIATGLPVTGQCFKPQQNPYDAPKRMTESEEGKLRLEEITSFKDRVGYFWYKAELPMAIKLTTPNVPPAHEIAGCTKEELARFAAKEPLGQGVTAAEILRALEARQASFNPARTRPATLQVVPSHPVDARPKRRLEETLEEEY